jgi:hypothetical protein
LDIETCYFKQLIIKRRFSYTTAYNYLTRELTTITANGAGVKPFPNLSWMFLDAFLSTKQSTITAMPAANSIASCDTGDFNI